MFRKSAIITQHFNTVHWMLLPPSKFVCLPCLYCWWYEIKKYKDGVASIEIMVMPSFNKTRQNYSKVTRRKSHRARRTHGHDTISLFLGYFHLIRGEKVGLWGYRAVCLCVLPFNIWTKRSISTKFGMNDISFETTHTSYFWISYNQ